MYTQELPGEQELIRRAQQGSVDAFEQLVLHYQDRLYRFLLARAANRADAEDALQETFVSAYRYLSSYRSRYCFSTWLFTIAVRQLSKLGRGYRVNTELLETLECTRPGPEQVGIQIQRDQSLWQTARTCLSEAQFVALWLFYIEDMSLTDIGTTMSRPLSWVKVNLMRARQRLYKELQDDHDGQEHDEPEVFCKEVTL